MTEILIIIVKLSAIAILPVLAIASYFKKIDVLNILTAFMFIGFLGMIALSFAA